MSVLLAGDWGSSNLRLFRMDEAGRVTASRESPSGAKSLGSKDFRGVFEDLAADLLDGGRPAGIVLCGMVGARQGWLEAPYAAAPAGAAEIAARFVEVETRFGPAFIAPGLIARRPGGGRADVMRGEETQILGAQAKGLVVTPGTHSKWARIEDGRITGFATYMTGELYEALKDHSMLGALMETGPHDPQAFALGVARARAEPLAALLFSVRSEGLTGALPGRALASYLSGLLIGAEIAAGLADPPGAAPTLIGAPALTGLYAAALGGFDLKPAAIVDGGAAVAAGLWRLWRERSAT